MTGSCINYEMQPESYGSPRFLTDSLKYETVQRGQDIKIKSDPNCLGTKFLYSLIQRIRQKVYLKINYQSAGSTSY